MASSSRVFATARVNAQSSRQFKLCNITPTFKRHSHVGTQPIQIPSGVSCSLASLPGRSEQYLRIQGAQGSREIPIPAGIQPIIKQLNPSSIDNGTPNIPSTSTSTSSPTFHSLTPSSSSVLNFTCNNPELPGLRAKWGLTAALVNNAVRGVHEGHIVKLRLVGVGYRAALEDAAGTSSTSTGNPSVTSAISTHTSKSGKILVMRLGYSRPVRIVVPSQITCTILSPTDIELQGLDKQKLGQFAASIRGWRPPEPYNGKGIFVGGETIRRKELKKK